VEIVIYYVPRFRAKWAKTDGLKGLYFLGVARILRHSIVGCHKSIVV